MPPRALLATLLVSALLLAGCASEPAAETAATSPSPVVFTSPDDMGNATGDANAPHLHDYWNGAETLVVLDAVMSTGTFVFSEYADFDFRPPAGGIVPQGTQHVEVRMSWTDTPTTIYSQPELWVKTAADNQPWLVGPIEQDVPLVIESTNDRNDLPHQSLSAWVFQLRIYPGEDNTGLTWFENDVQLHVTAHKGLEIPLFPPHPDLWQGATELPLFDVSFDPFVANGNPDEGMMCFFGCFDIVIPEDGAVVPSTGKVVEVTLTMGDDAPTQLGLSYHGADAREFTRLQPAEVEGKTRVYRIDILPGAGDGAYAKQSQWEFRVYPEEPVENEWHVGSYAMSAKVLRA